MVCIAAYVTVVLLLIFATISDLRTGKIPNSLIAAGYIVGLGMQLVSVGSKELMIAFFRAGWPIIVFYGLFYIRALGAGDIKLLSVTSTFFNFEQMLDIIIFSFLFGAGVCLARIIKDKKISNHYIKFSGFILLGVMVLLFKEAGFCQE